MVYKKTVRSLLLPGLFLLVGGGCVFAEKNPKISDSNAVAAKDEQTFAQGADSASQDSVQAVKPVPEWIQKEGIRAGFMSSTQGRVDKIPPLIGTAKSIGLNTAIVYGCSFAETPNHLKLYREWLKQCNRAGLHVFACYPWQPPVGNKCRPVVFADGTKGLFPCPLDNNLWDKYLMADIAGKLASLSLEGPNTSFDGYFLDMEMYGTERLRQAKRVYSSDTCFCDSCFANFILSCTKIKNLPVISAGTRKKWLSQNNYLADYYRYLRQQVEARAQALRENVHVINSNLLFGVYPALDSTNWVLAAVMKALGRNSYPVISFTTETYGYYGNRANPSTWGASRIPQDMTAYFDKYGINGIYAAGYLLRLYKSAELGDQLVRSCQNAQGYWLFRMEQLVDGQAIPESETLAEGSADEYRSVIKIANTAIDQARDKQ